MNVVNQDGMHNPVVLSPSRITFETRDTDRVPSFDAPIKRMQAGDKLPRRLSTCPVCCDSGMQLLSYKFDVCPECKGRKSHEIPIRRSHMFVVLLIVAVVSLLVTAVWIAILANGNTP